LGRAELAEIDAAKAAVCAAGAAHWVHLVHHVVFGGLVLLVLVDPLSKSQCLLLSKYGVLLTLSKSVFR
jgi:hypothetical protein